MQTNEELLQVHLSTGRELAARLRNARDTAADLALSSDAQNEIIAFGRRCRLGQQKIKHELWVALDALENAALGEPSLEFFDGS